MNLSHSIGGRALRHGARLVLLAAGLSTVVACRVPQSSLGFAPEASMPLACASDDETMPAVAEVGPANIGVMNAIPPMPSPPPLPYQVTGTWAPPGLALPWPRDEYLRDGGDHGTPVAVAPDWSVYGLELEDTVCHFDTLDGRTLVEPSNKVILYAPRFSAVRTVTRLAENEQADLIAGMNQPTKLVRHDDVDIAATSLQRVQPARQAGTKMAGLFRTRQWDGVVTQVLMPAAFQDAFLPYENISVIRTGQFANTEKARLAVAVQAAITWTADAAVQVIVDNKAAQALTGDRRVQTTYTIDDFSQPALRIIKVASTNTGEPGDTVDFTLRVVNIGSQVLGNIVVLDNLTTRLEYVPDTAQGSVPAEFSVKANSGDSLILRWELENPIEPGDGCVLRFRCVVR